jgi:hypothetical protein
MSLPQSQLDIIHAAMVNLEAMEALNDLTHAELYKAIKEAALWKLENKLRLKGALKEGEKK